MRTTDILRLLNKVELVTANVVSIVYLKVVNIMDWSQAIEPDRAIELAIAGLVGVSLAFWNIARGISALKGKKNKEDGL